MKHTSRIALVTGGTSSLGEAISLKLAALGYQLATAPAFGGMDAKAWLAAGPVDVLVNIAGTPLKMADRESRDADIEGRLASTFQVSTAAFEHMREHGRGRIIHIFSAHPQDKGFPHAGHSELDARMWNFTRELALEAAGTGVTVNAVATGYVGTKADTMAAEGPNAQTAVQPAAGHLGKPEEVAGLVAYIASDEAAFLNGARLAVNAGKYMA